MITTGMGVRETVRQRPARASREKMARSAGPNFVEAMLFLAAASQYSSGQSPACAFIPGRSPEREKRARPSREPAPLPLRRRWREALDEGDEFSAIIAHAPPAGAFHGSWRTGARVRPVRLLTTLRSVTCLDALREVETMSNFRAYPLTSDVGLMDERNERPVLIALVATVVAWLAVCVVVVA